MNQTVLKMLAPLLSDADLTSKRYSTPLLLTMENQQKYMTI